MTSTMALGLAKPWLEVLQHFAYTGLEYSIGDRVANDIMVTVYRGIRRSTEAFWVLGRDAATMGSTVEEAHAVLPVPTA